jgi:hypothetical protein
MGPRRLRQPWPFFFFLAAQDLAQTKCTSRIKRTARREERRLVKRLARKSGPSGVQTRAKLASTPPTKEALRSGRSDTKRRRHVLCRKLRRPLPRNNRRKQVAVLQETLDSIIKGAKVLGMSLERSQDLLEVIGAPGAGEVRQPVKGCPVDVPLRKRRDANWLRGVGAACYRACLRLAAAASGWSRQARLCCGGPGARRLRRLGEYVARLRTPR